MADYPPYMNSYGLISKILNKIKSAKTPERFTQDYLGTVLGYTSGSAKTFIPFAKRIGLLGSDGAPTELYKRFRNPDSSGTAMAAAIKKGYSSLFEKNEFAYNLKEEGVKGLLVEVTGLEKNSKTLKAIYNSFSQLLSFASFDSQIDIKEVSETHDGFDNIDELSADENDELKLNLSYTINLVLPKTDDVAVFNSIFKALKENLLRK